ncbi:FecR family protein [uncultured Polaribacter sp.]|uniref:FecR family protein n=1 Tax=uncultured Polaribacter sp. TaxID=174711 RepID=UPI002634335C|nr:FecR domain-containing protein [uncultured Polaribacter sp.]
MILNKVQNIIIKYLSSQASISELDALEVWLENSDNEKEFIKYVKVNYLIDMNLKEFKTKKSEEKLLQFISKDKKVFKLKKVKMFFKYAASIAILISASYYYTENNIQPTEKNISSKQITLKMDNGTIKVIDEKGSFTIQDTKGNIIGNQQGNELVYDTKKATDKLAYNTITVPYGKRFAVKLSDGTKVHLNAGTSFRYPVKFLKGKNRQVFIETGEAYFDVVKDAKHPFIVNNNNVNIRVLGTQFNVTSYPEDSNITTVLVEGSVRIYASKEKYDANKSTLLKPGFKADWNKYDNFISVEKADVETYTAWIDGKIILKHITFNNIIKKLERHYDIEIINNNKDLGKDFITATFDIETIAEVFKVINEIHPINYTITNNKITIN